MKSPYSTVTMVLGTPTFIVRVDLLSFNLRIKVQWLDFGICEFGIKVDFFVGLLEEWTFMSFTLRIRVICVDFGTHELVIRVDFLLT